MVSIFKKMMLVVTLVTAVCLTAVIVGATEGELSLKLVQCIEAALVNNRDIMIEHMNVKQADGEVTRAWSTFDPIATADAGYYHSEQPAGSQLLGANVSEQAGLTCNMGLQTMVPTGSFLRLEFQNERTESNSTWQSLNPQYETALQFSITQPLLKGFGFTPNLYRVRLAKNNRAISEMALQEVVLRTISEVEQSYWNLVLANENLRVNKLSKELALEILRMTETQVRIGVLPPVATLQAEAAAASREEGVILAENSVRMTQRELLRVMNAYHKKDPISVVPQDRPAPVQPMPDMRVLRAEALRNNFQLRQLEMQLRNAAMGRSVARNSVLPRLDLVGSVGLVGLSGDSGNRSTSVIETGRVIPDPTGTSVGILETTTVTSPENAFDGTYYDAIDMMLSGDYVQWSIGMQVQYPLGNRSARKDYSRALIEERKTMLQVEKARDLIRTMIENLIGNLETSIKRVEATTKAAELALKNMETEEKKFKVGISTNRDVLEDQEGYAMALTAQVQALIDYNKSRGSIERARMGYVEFAMQSPASIPSPQMPSGAGLDSQSPMTSMPSQGGMPSTSGLDIP